MTTEPRTHRTIGRRTLLGGAVAAALAGSLLSERPAFADSRASRLDQRRIDAVADSFDASLIGLRRDIHQHPELAGQEIRTSGLVAERFRAAGLDVITYTGYTIEEILEHSGRPTVACRESEIPESSASADPDMNYRDSELHAGYNSSVSDAFGATDTAADYNDDGFYSLLSQTDILIDGPYIKELRTLDAPHRGSSNQRVINVAATLANYN
jgi:hypothetical protein